MFSFLIFMYAFLSPVGLVPCDINEVRYYYHQSYGGNATDSLVAEIFIEVPQFQTACTIDYTIETSIFSGLTNSGHPNILCTLASAATEPGIESQTFVNCQGVTATPQVIRIITNSSLYHKAPALVSSSEGFWFYIGHATFLSIITGG